MRYLLRTLAVACSLALAGPGAAVRARETPAAPAAAKAVTAATARPALWKIADPDTTIYLFGTVHALPAGIDWLHGPVADALKQSAQLVTEIPATEASEMQAAVMKSATLPAGQTLRGMLAANDRARFEQALAQFNLPAAAFDGFQPWYAAIALTSLPLAQGGYTAANGVEHAVAAVAQQQGKQRTGLETASHQLAMFASLPLEVQKRYLHEVLEGLPTLDQQLTDIIREWSAGNPDKLAELLNEEQDDPVMIKVLLTDRNRMWVDWARLRMEQPGTVFMAVGAGHLGGGEGMLGLLAKAGLEPVRIQ
ncbi:MAG: TraB/GumN family protein [Pseudomonadota bacterium]